MPKVTVAMPVYNDAAYVREAIDSILAQTLRDFELLIIDDGSTDATPDIIATYCDKRIRVIRFEQNKGRPFARNAALDAAQGKYFAWMDGDDISLPNRLEQQIAFLDSHPQIAVCSCAMQCFQERHDCVRLPETHDAILAGIVWEPTISNAACCMRLESVRAHGLRYREDLLRVEDYAFWADLLLGTPLRAANLSEVLYRWRYFHRPTSPTYHAKAAQYVLSYLGLPDDTRSACIHTILSCSSHEAMPAVDTGAVLAWANKVYEAVQQREGISTEAFLATSRVKVEKYFCVISFLLQDLQYYRQLPLAAKHSIWRLLVMVAVRKVYRLVKVWKAAWR